MSIFQVRPQDSETKQTARAQLELRRLRAGRVEKEPKIPRIRFPWDREKYELQVNNHGHTFDHKRRVSPCWRELEMDQAGFSMKWDGLIMENQEEFDAWAEAETQPLKVRWLRGAKAGAVQTLSVLDYIRARGSASMDAYKPECEPVPTDEPERGPFTLSKTVPTSFSSARKQAALALGKQPEALSFDEVVAYVATLKTKNC